MKTVYEIIKELENTNSSNEKLAIMESNKDNEVLKKCFEFAYSPTINFFIKKIPDGWQHEDRMETQWVGVFSQLAKLANREVTGNKAKDELTSMLNQIDCNMAEVVTRIISGDMRCGVGRTICNKVWKGLIVVPPRQGCASMNEKTLNKIGKCKELAIELKSDGSYAASVCGEQPTLMSRNGSPLLGLAALEAELAHEAFRGFVLEGELVYDTSKSDRGTGNGIIGKVVKGTATEEERNGVHLQVWDCIDVLHYESKGKYPVENKVRRKHLENMLDRANCKNITIIPRTENVTMEEADVVFENYVKEGFEGAILKDMNAGWSDNGKASTCVKMKRRDPADLVVVGMVEGKGKAIGSMGMVLLESSCGTIKVGCGSGFSDEQRKHYWNNDPTGSIFETKYDSITCDKKTGQQSLFLPIFKCERFDKDIADSYQEILDKVLIK